ncbi:MAG: IS200/IS605 family element transposase accessory protein TnpB [Chloroflexi bacterium]|nr:IS200/IS605 family element transposase accessory protein TnpB [Chloroflexota bacterium]
MKRGHRIALKPTQQQEAAFRQHAGYARFAYNWAVNEFKTGLESGEWLSEKTLRPRWNKVKRRIAPWSHPLSQNAAKYAIINFGRAADGWGTSRIAVKSGKCRGRRVGFPRFKRRKHEQGFRADNGPGTVRVDGKTVRLPKIGMVPMVEELRFTGSIREVTINRTAGVWFACFSVEDGQPIPPVKPGQVVGVDVGVGVLAVCSNGLRVRNPKSLNARVERLRRIDKALARSRNVHGKTNRSKRRDRMLARRRRIHAKIVRVRNDNHHKATTAIAKRASLVVVETLNVSGMTRNRRLARAVADAGLSGFLAMLEYKCVWYGSEFVKADRWFPSSQLCARCGWRNAELTLSDRRWRCGGCGVLNERDENAALNLKNWPSSSFSVSGRGDRASPTKSAVACEASTGPVAAPGLN